MREETISKLITDLKNGLTSLRCDYYDSSDPEDRMYYRGGIDATEYVISLLESIIQRD